MIGTTLNSSKSEKAYLSYFGYSDESKLFKEILNDLTELRQNGKVNEDQYKALLADFASIYIMKLVEERTEDYIDNAVKKSGFKW